MTVLRVLLADDHPLYRDGVARSLRDAGDIDIVGEAQDGESAAAMCVALRPDLVLLDISMPKGGGIGALGQIMQMETPPLVAMLTASEDGARTGGGAVLCLARIGGAAVAGDARQGRCG
jgi:two-component system, NarL family, nitrate/nitrite response regulator NarL